MRLAPDDQDPRPRDVTAGGTLHWAPRHDPGLARRSAQILAWLADARPSLVVVDVSVEVALLVRLAGVPVVVAAMRGDRSDRPHVTAYDLADALLAPWSEDVPAPWPQRWLDKTTHVGALSRFDGWHRPAHRVSTGRPTALLLWGEGGGGPTDQEIARMRAATPEWDWQLAHPGSRLGPEQLWAALCGADVVVTHGGQNAVAEVAAARAPAVVVAGPRPFDEQHHTVAAAARRRPRRRPRRMAGPRRTGRGSSGRRCGPVATAGAAGRTATGPPAPPGSSTCSRRDRSASDLPVLGA